MSGRIPNDFEGNAFIESLPGAGSTLLARSCYFIYFFFSPGLNFPFDSLLFFVCVCVCVS